jgi:hypothetical protein
MMLDIEDPLGNGGPDSISRERHKKACLRVEPIVTAINDELATGVDVFSRDIAPVLSGGSVQWIPETQLSTQQRSDVRLAISIFSHRGGKVPRL